MAGWDIQLKPSQPRICYCFIAREPMFQRLLLFASQPKTLALRLNILQPALFLRALRGSFCLSLPFAWWLHLTAFELLGPYTSSFVLGGQAASHRCLASALAWAASIAALPFQHTQRGPKESPVSNHVLPLSVVSRNQSKRLKLAQARV